MKSHWDTYQGVRFFHFNLSGFGEDEKGAIEECDAADAVIMAEPLGSVLILNDVRDSVGTIDVIQHLQMSAERSSPYIARAAVVGVEGVKSILLQVVNRFSKRPIVPFDNIEEAKNWLVQPPLVE